MEFSPEVEKNPKTTTGSGIHRKQGYVRGNNTKVILGFRISKISGFSSRMNFLERIGEKVAKALKLMSSRKKSSRKVSSSASLAKSRSYAETLDSHRAEAIEDCIEFLNSSSSLQRSNSISSSC
ncbi:hypothetical protein M9H77_22912 [Catharanthus roseus]|uniref:Uncharacterized protein n=1 Tax=Catharanthus roseus TaxID=4058 RepID=A0ACC0ASS4_CATRO|nr:hypothetical protein M9H77_22912 [Catharanthus roseus]